MRFVAAPLGVLGIFLAGCGGLDARSDALPEGSGGLGGSGGGGAGGKGLIGGNGGSSAAGSGGAAGSATATATPFSLRGSFDVAFTSVESTVAMGQATKQAPSLLAKVRIDIPDPPSSGTWQALVTPRGGQPTLFKVTASDGALKLTGTATFKAPLVTDVWQSLVIPLDGNGQSLGTLTGNGEESVFSTGVGASGKLAGIGTIGPDVTPPEGRAASTSFGPSDRLLPWEALTVTFAEPVAEDDARTHLSVANQGGTAVPGIGWSFFPSGPEKVNGIVTGVGYLPSWDAGALEVRLGGGYVDLAQNSGGGFAQPLALVAIPKLAAGESFDTAGSPLASWGEVSRPTFDSGQCEQGGCAVVGPFPVSACGVSPSGFAVRLEVGASSSAVKIRYRVVFSALPTQLGSSPFAAQIARPGHAPTVTDTPAVAPTDHGVSAGDLRYSTPWATLVVPIPKGTSTEVGVALRAGGQASSAACDASPNGPTPISARLFVDSVAGY